MCQSTTEPTARGGDEQAGAGASDDRPNARDRRHDQTAAQQDGARSTNELPCAHLPLLQRLEALLFAADRPLSDSRILELLGWADGKQHDLDGSVVALNRAYASEGRCFRIERVAGGLRVLTLPEFGPLVERLKGQREHHRLSQAALETLAIVAYRQPVLRAELEAIRGVACGEVLRTLIERRLVRVSGRAELVGKPLLYGTTREFLQTFGLARVQDLPEVASAAGDSR